MIEFKPVNPTDRAVFESFYDCKEIRNAESSFANLCAYSFIYHGEYAIVKNCLVTRIHFDYGKRISYHPQLSALLQQLPTDVIQVKLVFFVISVINAC